MTIRINNGSGGGGGGGVSDHDALNNLDFPSAGHTGDLDLGANKLSATIVTANTIFAGTLTASTVLATTTSATTILATTTSATTTLATTLSGTTLRATTVTCSAFYSTSTSVVYSAVSPIMTIAGQIGVDVTTTTGSAFRFFSNAEYVLPGYQSKSFTVVAPVVSTYSIWRVPYDITLKNVNCLVAAGASTSLTGAIYEGNGNGTSLVTSTVSAAILGAVNTASNIADGTFDAGDYLVWVTTATSGVGAINQLTATIDYTVDANT